MAYFGSKMAPDKLYATYLGSAMPEKQGDPEPSPYTRVEAISATGAAFIAIVGTNFDSAPTVSVDMKLSPDLTRFYHGFSGSYIASYFTCHPTNYRFQLAQHEWQAGSMTGSDARLRQTITYSREDILATITSSLGGTLSKDTTFATTSEQVFSLFSSDPGNYGYKGGCYVFGVTIVTQGVTSVWEPVIRNDDNAVGIYNEATDTFIGNTATTGSIYVPSEYAAQLMALSVEPQGTPTQQKQQLQDLGVEA